MLPSVVKNKIEQIWLDVIAGGVSQPTEVIEQLTYLMFAKQIDEREADIEMAELLSGEKQSHIFGESREEQALRWRNFKGMEARALHKHFVDRVFIFLINLNSNENSAFSRYLKHATFKINEPLALQKVVAGLEDLFENDIKEMSGKMGIGCISDNEPQPLLINCRLGSYAIVSVGRVANMEELIQDAFDNGHTHFLEMSGGEVNQTELIAAMINQKDNYVDGIINVLRKVKGSISFMLMTKDGLYLVRDKLGRTPLNIGKGENGFCASFESHAYINLGYSLYKELGPGEVCFMTSEEVKTLVEANDKMKICSFLWVYYGYPTSCYEGRNVEEMRYECGRLMAQRDDIKDIDLVAGVPDSGIAHAIGYSNESHIQYGRPFIKYTPTWPRSFMPQIQADRNLIAKMKLIPIASLIKGKSLLLIDDSIVRGTQLRDTTEYLYNSGARAVHIRPACPPIMYGCPYLNFSRSTSDMDLITRRVIRKREGENDINMLETYSDPDTPEYNAMVEEIRKELNFTSLRFNRLDDMLQAIGLDSDKICTYCFNGKK